MSDSGKKQKLGRGLSALLGEDRTGVAGSSSRNPTQQSLSITQLRPGKFQPRQQFDDTRLQELADSIREKGILQPVLVRPLAGEEGQFEIIAGERRWRAAPSVANTSPKYPYAVGLGLLIIATSS